MRFSDLDVKYGRAFLVGSVFIIWGVILLSFYNNGYLQTWMLWKIPADDVMFLDFRVIPAAAETFKSGIDPAVSNPNDPAGRPFNYPKIWYLFFFVPLSQNDTIWMSISLIVLFFVVLFIFPEHIRMRDAILFLWFIFSPACMLLYERGNIDMLFFFLCGVAIMTISWMPIVATIVFLAASFFKLFPFFGIPLFFHEDKNRFYKFFGVVMLIFLIYLMFNVDSLRNSWHLTQRGVRFSYGMNIIFVLLDAYFYYYLIKIMTAEQVRTAILYLPYLTVLIGIAGAFFVGVVGKNTHPIMSERNLTAFRVGAGIYVGTFLLGNNWDYRLSFLLFVIPQLCHWFFESSRYFRLIYLGVLFAIFFSCWSTVIFHYGLEFLGRKFWLHLLIFDEIMNWGVLLGLTYLLVASSPGWFRTFSLNPFSRRSQ